MTLRPIAIMTNYVSPSSAVFPLSCDLRISFNSFSVPHLLCFLSFFFSRIYSLFPPIYSVSSHVSSLMFLLLLSIYCFCSCFFSVSSHLLCFFFFFSRIYSLFLSVFSVSSHVLSFLILSSFFSCHLSHVLSFLSLSFSLSVYMYPSVSFICILFL